MPQATSTSSASSARGMRWNSGVRNGESTASSTCRRASRRSMRPISRWLRNRASARRGQAWASPSRVCRPCRPCKTSWARRRISPCAAVARSSVRSWARACSSRSVISTSSDCATPSNTTSATHSSSRGLRRLAGAGAALVVCGGAGDAGAVMDRQYSPPGAGPAYAVLRMAGLAGLSGPGPRCAPTAPASAQRRWCGHSGGRSRRWPGQRGLRRARLHG